MDIALNINVLAAGQDLRGHGSPKPSIEGGALHGITRSHDGKIEALEHHIDNMLAQRAEFGKSRDLNRS